MPQFEVCSKTSMRMRLVFPELCKGPLRSRHAARDYCCAAATCKTPRARGRARGASLRVRGCGGAAAARRGSEILRAPGLRARFLWLMRRGVRASLHCVASPRAAARGSPRCTSARGEAPDCIRARACGPGEENVHAGACGARTLPLAAFRATPHDSCVCVVQPRLRATRVLSAPRCSVHACALRCGRWCDPRAGARALLRRGRPHGAPLRAKPPHGPGR
jgi:hypothetical protein